MKHLRAYAVITLMLPALMNAKDNGFTIASSTKAVDSGLSKRNLSRGAFCARAISYTPETLSCAIEGRWVAAGAQYHGETIYWTTETDPYTIEFSFNAGVVQLVDAAHYTIMVEAPVVSDCGLYNWVAVKVNGVTVATAQSYGGSRVLRALFKYEKTNDDTDTVSVVFTTDNDGGAFTQGAILHISKDAI